MRELNVSIGGIVLWFLRFGSVEAREPAGRMRMDLGPCTKSMMKEKLIYDFEEGIFYSICTQDFLLVACVIVRLALFMQKSRWRYSLISLGVQSVL